MNAQIKVSPNVQVSADRASVPHDEVMIGSGAKAGEIIACSMAFTSASGVSTIVYSSSDRGQHWHLSFEAKRYDWNGDPDCTYGPDGIALFSTLSSVSGDTSELRIYRSSDRGETWAAATVPRAIRNVDRPYLAVDRSTSIYAGRIYVFGQAIIESLDKDYLRNPYALMLWRSLDRGVSYERPIARFPSDSGERYHPGNCEVLSNGVLVCVFAQLEYPPEQVYAQDVRTVRAAPNGRVRIVTSTDGGETLTEARTVSPVRVDWRESASTLPRLAADHSNTPFRDRLYAVWVDRQSGRNEILLARSSDGGRTWSGPRPVSDNGSPRDDVMPAIVVNPTGVVGVSWYDRRDNPDNLGYYVRFAASMDGGDTFLPSVRVAEAARTVGQHERWIISALPTIRPSTSDDGISVRLYRNDWLSGGHTAGLTADADGAFHLLWVDNRTGIHQIWTAKVDVNGTALPHADAGLTHLDDVSKSVSLAVESTLYDRSSNTLTVSARLQNTSADTLHGPLKVRVLSLSSEIGVPLITNADSRDAGPGAVWDFTKLMRGSVLPPHDSSAVKQLVFRFSDLRPPPTSEIYTQNLFVLSLEARVLAGGTSKPIMTQVRADKNVDSLIHNMRDRR